jgi:hypothetical protein
MGAIKRSARHLQHDDSLLPSPHMLSELRVAAPFFHFFPENVGCLIQGRQIPYLPKPSLFQFGHVAISNRVMLELADTIGQ